MANQWYPFYPGDYGRDTGRLKLAEHGAYLLLLNDYYSTGGPLPLNEHELFCICKAFTEDDRLAVLKVVGLFFDQTDEGYRNHRADKEIVNQAAKYEKAKTRAENAAAARWEKEKARKDGVDAQAMLGASENDACSNACAMPTTTTTTTTETFIEGRKEGAEILMTLSEFTRLYFDCLGSMMPGGLNNDALTLCRKYSGEKIQTAFLMAAERGGKSLAYVKTILEGKTSPAQQTKRGGGITAAEAEEANRAACRAFVGGI